MFRKVEVGVIGLGKFGFSFGAAMMELGNSVIGIDIEPDHIRRAQQVLTQVYQADATDKAVLEQLGIGDLEHVLVSVGESITASMMISLYLKEMKVKTIWAKAVNGDHQKLLNRIGVSKVIIPEEIAAKQLANKLVTPGFVDNLPFGNDVIIQEIIVEKWAGKTLRELDLTNQLGVQVVAVKKAGEGNFHFIPKANDQLDEMDILVVIGNRKNLAKINP